MKRNRYTKQRKIFALQCLMRNYGDTSLTSVQLGIPKRTIQRWMEQDKSESENNRYGADALREENNEQWRTNAIIEGETNADETLPEGEYARIRHQVMQHVNALLVSLTDDPDTAHLRVNALSRLLDRAIKLESLIPKEGPQKIIIEYRYPDGTMHDIPPWANSDFEDTPPQQANQPFGSEETLSMFDGREQTGKLSPEEYQAFLREQEDLPLWDYPPTEEEIPEETPHPQEDTPRRLTREEYKAQLREQEKDFAWSRKNLIQYKDSW